MIQRIQSLFLLLAAACYVWGAFLPIASLYPKQAGEEHWILVEDGTETPVSEYAYSAWTVSDTDGNVIARTAPIAVLELLLGVCAIVVLFLFKNRKLQAKLCLGHVFFGFVLLALMLFVYPDMLFPKHAALKGVETVYSLWTLVPMVGILLVYVAQKFILKDEKLVRSSERLR
ncbi:MAG: DUF4293 domain-containing protein [Bacteroidales bacterium]|nr:DUF4293 domain-containing protein [Bacteroidales bacterium]